MHTIYKMTSDGAESEIYKKDELIREDEGIINSAWTEAIHAEQIK